MLQLWFIAATVNCVSGTAFLIVLLFYRRFYPRTDFTLEQLIVVYVLINSTILVSLYFRLIGIPRNIIGYRIIHAGVWGYATLSLLRHLLPAENGNNLLPSSVGILQGTLLLLSNPFDSIGPGLPYGKICMAASVATVAVLSILGARKLLGTSRHVGDMPWSILRNTVGWVLMILPLVELADFIYSHFLLPGEQARHDGFPYLVCSIIANGTLIAGIFLGIRRMPIGKSNRRIALPKDLFGFSRREEQVAEQVINGKTSRDIAADLGISSRTVDAHLRSIYRKCRASNRTELVTRIGRR